MSRLPLALLCLVTALALICSSDPDVKEHSVDYSCCEPPAIHPKPHCEHTVVAKGETIAYINGAYKMINFPCQEIGDNVKMCECIDFRVDTFCKNGKFMEDEIIHYKAQSCQQLRSNRTPPQPRGPVGLLPLALLITGFFIFC